MIAYKLVRKMKDGSLSSLFIAKKQRLPVGKWLDSENIPTRGFTVRKGWHCTKNPSAPHLSKRDRVWVIVEIREYSPIKKPECQGGIWYLAGKMKILRELIERDE